MEYRCRFNSVSRSFITANALGQALKEVFTMAASGAPVPGQKADGRKGSGTLRAAWVAKERAGRAGLGLRDSCS